MSNVQYDLYKPDHCASSVEFDNLSLNGCMECPVCGEILDLCEVNDHILDCVTNFEIEIQGMFEICYFDVYFVICAILLSICRFSSWIRKGFLTSFSLPSHFPELLSSPDALLPGYYPCVAGCGQSFTTSEMSDHLDDCLRRSEFREYWDENFGTCGALPFDESSVCGGDFDYFADSASYGFLSEDATLEELVRDTIVTCPLCLQSIAFVSSESAMEHINHCMDAMTAVAEREIDAMISQEVLSRQSSLESSERSERSEIDGSLDVISLTQSHESHTNELRLSASIEDSEVYPVGNLSFSGSQHAKQNNSKKPKAPRKKLGLSGERTCEIPSTNPNPNANQSNQANHNSGRTNQPNQRKNALRPGKFGLGSI